MPDSDPDNWSLSELDLAYGSISPRAICRFSNFLMLLNKNGIFDISQAQMGVMNSTALSWEIEPDVQSFVSTYLTGASAVMTRPSSASARAGMMALMGSPAGDERLER